MTRRKGDLLSARNHDPASFWREALIGESIVMSLFTFLLINIRGNPQMTSSYIRIRFKSWKSWSTWAVCARPERFWTYWTFLDIFLARREGGSVKNPSGLNRVNKLTLTTTLVTTTKGVNLPTTTVFRISLVAPVIVIQLIYPIIFWSVTVLVDNIILVPTFVVYQTKP